MKIPIEVSTYAVYNPVPYTYVYTLTQYKPARMPMIELTIVF